MIIECSWAQCEACDKWRKLPLTVDVDSLPDQWYCSLNVWEDAEKNKCSAPQESPATDEVDAQSLKRPLVGHASDSDCSDDGITLGSLAVAAPRKQRPGPSLKSAVASSPSSSKRPRAPGGPARPPSASPVTLPLVSPPLPNDCISLLPARAPPRPSNAGKIVAVGPGSFVYLVSPQDEGRYWGRYCAVSSSPGSLLVGRTVRHVGDDCSPGLVVSFDTKTGLHWVATRPDGTVAQPVSLGSDWELLDHGGSFLERRNDAALGAPGNSDDDDASGALVGDMADSEAVAWANTDWLSRRRGWEAGRRGPVAGEAASGARWGLPPIGCILAVKGGKGVGFEVTAARCWYPEDTARGREPAHGADEMFLAAEASEEGGWRLVTCVVRVADLEWLQRAPVELTTGRHSPRSRGSNIPAADAVTRLRHAPQWPRGLSVAYCTATDSYLACGNLQLPFLLKKSSGNPSFDLRSATVLDPAVYRILNRSPSGDIVSRGQALFSAATHGPSPQREGGLGRLVYVRTSSNDSASSWRLGLVIAYNTSSMEHFVEFEPLVGEWLSLRGEGSRWVATENQDTISGNQPMTNHSTPSTIRPVWVPSSGCWLAVSEDFWERYQDLDSDKPAGHFLAKALAMPAAKAPEPFELPASLLELIHGSTPLAPQAPVTAPPPGNDFEERFEACARARPWEKTAHDSRKRQKRALHERRRVAPPGAEACDEASPVAPATAPFEGAVARARASRCEARQVRGGLRGFAREDGRLEQGGVGTGSRRLRFGRSTIQGWGVFTDEAIGEGEPILEYRGVVIGNAVADKREKEYRREGRDDYQFRMDAETVVDATKRGSLARYVNHSCDPNCFTDIIDYGSKKKIVIFAKRRIVAGEELKYDYKFGLESDLAKKLPCYCGAEKCVGWMN